MIRRTIFTIALALITGPAAFAQLPPQPPPANMMQGSEQDRAACHPDVIKFCRSLVKEDDSSDVFAILSCLQTNRSRISHACNTVLVSHGQ